MTLRIDTPIEVDYYRHGGILPYVLRGKLAGGVFGTRRFSDSGTLDWPEPPRVY